MRNEPKRNMMSEEPIEFIVKNFTGARYYPKYRLLTWHPAGVLDEPLADKVMVFVEWEEYLQEAPFDRYVDFSGFAEIRISTNHVFEMARRRRIVRQPVKSAFYADKPFSLAIAQMYERLMEAATMITVRSFYNRESAAEWLEVPVPILYRPDKEHGIFSSSR